MPRPSPQTERLVEVVELLAASGSIGRTLAELSRHLGVDKATCYPMLVELTRVGWLVRNPRDKTYHLGPRLVPIGHAAQRALDLVDLARPRMVELAQRLDAICVLTTLSWPDLVIADIAIGSQAARRRDPLGAALGLQVGDTIAFRPPLGSVLVAWSGEAAIRRWITASEVDDATEARLRAAVEGVRRTGYAVEEFPGGPEAMAAALEGSLGLLRGSRRAAKFTRYQLDEPDVGRLVVEVDPDGQYHPVSINAPVFGHDGEPVNAIAVMGLATPMSGREIAEVGGEVMHAARQIERDAGVQ